MHSFVLGFTLSVIFCVLSGGPVALLAGLVAACLGLLNWRKQRAGRYFLLAWFTGLIWASVAQHVQFSRQLSERLIRQDVLIEGFVLGVPQSDKRRARFDLRVTNSVPEHVLSKGRVKLNWYNLERPPVQTGDHWRFTVRLKPPSGLGNAGGFDFGRWLFHEGVVATGYVRDSPSPVLVSRHPLKLDGIRTRIAKRIASLPSANEYVAVVQGLSIGIKNELPAEHLELLRNSGTAHLLAISGLHIGLVSGWVFYLSGFVWRHVISFRLSPLSLIYCSSRAFCTVASVLFAIGYAALAGFSLPTQRALLMLLGVSVALLSRRFWPPWTAYLIAVFVVLLVSPLSVLSAGFWLSFTTVAALVYLHVGRISQQHGLLQGLRTHLLLGVVLLPASAWFFQNGALIAPAANAIAVPMIGVIVVPLSIAIAGLSYLSPALADLILQFAQWILAKVFSILHWLMQFEWSNVLLVMPSALSLVFCTLGIALLFAPRGLRLRWLSLPLLLPLILFNTLGRESDVLELHVLDVGQGHAALIFTRHYTVLFDTGNRFSDSTMAERVVVPFLHAKGRDSIDYVIVSHADADHSAGLAWLVKKFPEITVYASDEKNRQSERAYACRAGHTWYLEEVGFSFLHPADGDFGDKNNQSCVLLVHAGAARVLLTGDIEKSAEAKLTARLETLPVQVMVAPHHGSRSSSSLSFIQKFIPSYVVFPAGYGNKFGFPHDDIVQRYHTIGSKTINTGDTGSASFHFDRGGLLAAPELHWQGHRRFWR